MLDDNCLLDYHYHFQCNFGAIYKYYLVSDGLRSKSYNTFGLLLLKLLLCFTITNGLFHRDCNFSQRLKPGNMYYVYNPDYPNASSGRQYCKWIAESDYRVRLTCNTFNMAWSFDCSADRLTVHVNESTAHSYCDNGRFTVESTGKLMTIELSTVLWSKGVRFLCELEAIEKPREDDCMCGWKKPSLLRKYEGTKIVGGVETEVNEYPMMAGLVDPFEREVYCGATIISIKHVVTAAHCLTNRAVNNVGVLVGDHDITTGADTNAAKLYKAARFDVHPYYRKSSLENDIAIITVTPNIIFSPEVGPVCLPFQHQQDSFAGNYVTLLGWGTTEFGGMKSNTLRKVPLSILTESQCRGFYEGVTYKQICTFGKERDACQFDSGGPVLWQNPATKRVVLVGIINFGVACGSDKPGVNTRVNAYLDWIIYVTSGVAYCKAE